MPAEREVVIIGAGGHGRVAAEALAAMGNHRLRGFLDGNAELAGTGVFGSTVLGDESLLPKLREDGVRLFHIGVGSAGDTGPRRRLFDVACEAGLEPLTILHPAAHISPSAVLGGGSIALPNAVIHTQAQVGENVIVNTAATIEHDCQIGRHVHIAPGVTLSGNAHVGEGAHVGAGATAIQGVRIGAHSLIAAGAVVVEDIPDSVLAAGVPATVRRAR